MKKCEKCKFYFGDSQERFERGVCANSKVIEMTGVIAEAMDITTARDVCDREGNGHFVYFEPLTPAAGAAFVQITREPAARPWAMVATQ